MLSEASEVVEEATDSVFDELNTSVNADSEVLRVIVLDVSLPSDVVKLCGPSPDVNEN